MSVAYVPIIVVCCYLIGEIYKLIFKKFDRKFKYIPIVTTMCGGVLAVLIYFTAPEIVNAGNVYEALLVGFVSGASSTGTNQIVKQLFSKNNGGNNNGK
ncbi:MAG: phage holin family protein [Bacilli bacterium]|jgi:hypothetical protein|nr:phage holin family protein [Bacilli bacterium]